MSLLAVDLGIKTGLAMYHPTGHLSWYRSKNFGSRAALRAGVATLFHEWPELTWVVLEGGGDLAEIWRKEATRRHLNLHQIQAPTWRNQLLLPRQQQHGSQAKHYADQLARRVIIWSQLARPTALRHDTAEAILIGLWGVLTLGWLPQLPPELQPL